MTPVVTTPEADAAIRAVDEWWRAHRGAAPELFHEELAEAISLLSVYPEIGRRYRHRLVSGVRRLLLRATRYRVFDHASVTVLSIWSAVRGRGPTLLRP